MARKKLSVRVRRVALTPPPATRRRKLAPIIKLKKKPRGAPFMPGNRFGISTRFKPGNRANPEGRPSIKKLNEACRDVLARIVPREELVAAGLPVSLFGYSYAELNAWVLQQEGMRGNVGAIAEVGDRAEGRPATSASVDGNDSPIAILIASMNARSDEIGAPEGQERKQLTDGASHEES